MNIASRSRWDARSLDHVFMLGLSFCVDLRRRGICAILERNERALLLDNCRLLR